MSDSVNDISADRETLLHRVEAAPFSFDFFMAVRRLEAMFRHLPRTGHSTHVNEDIVRFAQTPSMAFAPSTLASFERRNDGRVPRLSVHFFGLLGPNGAMPFHFTDYVRDRERNADDATIARFLDVFHHRMTSLFYRAWSANQQTVSHDRADSVKLGEDRWADYVGSLIGIGTESFTGRDSVPDAAKLHYAGRLSPQPKNAEGLEAIISDFFGIDAELEQFVGQWLNLPADANCQLGKPGDGGRLGQSLVVGTRVWDCQLKFRLKLGPMNFADYQRMLPGGNSLVRLVDWVKNYVGDELEWDSRLVLKKEEIPQLRLGQVGQLGWSTWVHSRPIEKDADDLVLRPQASQSGTTLN